MRTQTMRRTLRFSTAAIVLMLLTAGIVHSQVRPRNSTRPPTRRQQTQSRSLQSSQSGQSGQLGQPDFAGRMAERSMQRIQEMQRDIEEMRRQAEESRNRAIQQTVGASDDQWLRLKPKLDRIEQLKAESEVGVKPDSMGGNGNFQTFTFGNSPGGMMGGGFASFSAGGGLGGGGGSGGSFAPVDILDSNTPSTPPSGGSGSTGPWATNLKSVTEMSEGEAICQELQQLLQGQSVPSAAVAQKVAALRRGRAQARDNLAKARQELRTIVTPTQEPALILMGYLD